MNYFNLLISFCNNKLKSSSQTVYVGIPRNMDRKDVIILPVFSGFNKPIKSLTGMCKGENSIFLFSPGYPSEISILSNLKLIPINTQTLQKVDDAHSAIINDGKLLVVSTGTDKIISYDIVDNELINPSVFWEFSSSNKDTIHINSIIKFCDDFYISAFGEKSGRLRSSARNGFIYNITKDKIVKNDIFHPHTLSHHNGVIYFLESGTGFLCSLNKKLIKLPGYARGLSWLNEHIVCLGTSIGREKSRSTGQFLNPSDPGKPKGKCEITLFDISKEKILLNIDLSEFGPEIYDIKNLDMGITSINSAITHHYLKERQIINEQSNELRKANEYYSKTISEQKENLDLVNQKLKQQKTEIDRLNNSLIRKTNEIEVLQEEIMFYALSKSWNYTRPLRSVIKKLKGKKND